MLLGAIDVTQNLEFFRKNAAMKNKMTLNMQNMI